MENSVTSSAKGPTSGGTMQEEECGAAARETDGKPFKREEIENKRQSQWLMWGWSAAPSAATKGLTQLLPTSANRVV